METMKPKNYQKGISAIQSKQTTLKRAKIFPPKLIPVLVLIASILMVVIPGCKSTPSHDYVQDIKVIEKDGKRDSLTGDFIVSGTIQNTSDIELFRIKIHVIGYDSGGRIFDDQTGGPDIYSLEPGAKATFKISLGNVISIDDPNRKIDSYIVEITSVSYNTATATPKNKP